MLCGMAVNVTVGGGETTVTSALLDVSPPCPLAVRIYVVVSVGKTAREPSGATGPIPGSRVTVSAWAVLHVSKLEAPTTIVFGFAERVASGGGIR
jgi:hypothetical protein